MQLEHVRDMGAFDYGAVMQMTPLIRRVVCRNPTPFTYTGTGTYIVGTGRVAVIDPGPPLSSHVDDVLAALGPGETVTHVLITHTHSDHSSLTARLQALTGARSYGFGPHGAVRAYDPHDRVDFSACFTAEEKTRFDKEWDDPAGRTEARGPPTSTSSPTSASTMAMGCAATTWTLTAVHTPGHCSNHLCYHLQEENCLFSGDHVMGWATSVVSPPDGSMQDYLASLRKLLPRRAERYWPTHGPAITEPDRYVRACIAHREAREQQIIAHLRGGARRIADIVPEMYAGYDKRLWYPAANSVHAHLLHLVDTARARVVEGDEPKLTSIYELT